MKPRQKARLVELLENPEYRHEFFGSLISTTLAAQIKANRERRNWSQKRLGEHAGMLQSRISAMEDVNYQRWTIKTLKRLAEAFDVTLSVRFESFGKALDNLDGFHDCLVEEPYASDASIHGHAATQGADDEQAGDPSSTTLAPVVDLHEYRQDLSPKTAGATETAEGRVEYA